MPQCTQCLPGLFEFDHHTPVTCRELCGDSVTTLLPCDNDLGIPYDGCSDDCEIEDNFTCNPADLSICAYNGTISLTVVDLDRKRMQNQFEITLKIFPPLYVFSLISEQELKAIFAFANPQITIQSITYDPVTAELQIVADFTADFVDAEIEITFTPTNGNNPRFFDGQTDTVSVVITTQPEKILYYR